MRKLALFFLVCSVTSFAGNIYDGARIKIGSVAARNAGNPLFLSTLPYTFHGAAIAQRYPGEGEQVFIARAVYGTPFYTLSPASNPGLCVEAYANGGDPRADHVKLQARNCSGNPEQQFSFQPASNGHHMIQIPSSNKCWDVTNDYSGQDLAADQVIQQFDCKSGRDGSYPEVNETFSIDNI